MISRRAFLVGTAATPLIASASSPEPMQRDRRKMITPPKLKQGDLVAIVAPAGVSAEPDNLSRAKTNVESLGLQVLVMPNAGKVWGYLAGTDQERADDFNAAVNDRSIKGIITLRGGYGTMRILPLIDYDAFRKHPKVVMGYSDITGLLNALTRKSRVVTYHGPIAEAKFQGFEGEWMRKAIFDSGPIGLFGTPKELIGKAVEPAPRTIQSGKAKGHLIGGNLSLIAPCAGTRYGPEFEGAVLFLEDVGEDPYRVDRMLTSLWLGGHLEKLKGIVFGDFRPTRPGEVKDKFDFSMDQVFDNLRLWTKIPMYCGLYAGHIADKITLPIGAMVEMDANELALRTLE